MFDKLFAEAGLSLDRLRAFLSVAAAGSIVKATGGDAVKQSQYSRQIKELEDFFRIKLVERHGKGIRLTMNGRELSRISRFFLLGLSNFQRGCLAEEQTFRIGASSTFINRFLLPVVSSPAVIKEGTRYIVETASDDEIERRLHDLTLDFGVTTQEGISRPLQLMELGKWRLNLWVPRSLHKTPKSASIAWKHEVLPLVLARKELDNCAFDLSGHKPRLACDTFLQALTAMETSELASVLPDFIVPNGKSFFHVPVPALKLRTFRFRLAWNPRLFRLNPHAIRCRDFLNQRLSRQMSNSAVRTPGKWIIPAASYEK
jgi:DNA-binding transcriptional LysR family regulator